MTDDTAPRAEEHTMTDTTTAPLLEAARAAQEARIVRVTEDRRRRDAKEVAELRERAVDLTAELLGVETEAGDWAPHREHSSIDSSGAFLRGVIADVEGVTLLASRDVDRFTVDIRPAELVTVEADDPGRVVTSRFPIHDLADLPERIEELDETLAEIANLPTDDDGEPDEAPTHEQTVDRLFALESARRAADNGDLVGAVLYLAGRVDVLIAAVDGLRPRPINVEETDPAE